MKLEVIGSGSKGNCYVLHNDKEALILEAGIPRKLVVLDLLQKGIKAKVRGVLVSHEHKDHSKYVSDFLDIATPVFMTSGTREAIKCKSKILEPSVIIKDGGSYKPMKIGGFQVIAFETVHDAAEPVGFYIKHEECGCVVFATDTNYIPSTFKTIDNIMIECNYEESLLQKRDIPESLKERIRCSHMSINTCIEALKANDLDRTHNIVLIHISEGSGDPEAFRMRVAEHFSNIITPALPGVSLNFDKIPF